jgi:hypothetical protein
MNVSEVARRAGIAPERAPDIRNGESPDSSKTIVLTEWPVGRK